MSWPKGRPRPRKAAQPNEPIAIADEPALGVEAAFPAPIEETGGEIKTPADWRKGMLLNVRNHGDAYVITLYPEESRPEHPERELRFTNLGECQAFVSDWYSRQSHDPRAR